MKKFIVAVVLILLSITAFAQKDTTLINARNVCFSTETAVSKTGNIKVNYIANYNGEWYNTDKTSYTRYVTAKRFKVTPNIAMVYDEKSKSRKIIVL